jgi:general secretion pathway protein K
VHSRSWTVRADVNPARSRSSEKGVALVAVLWVVALLSMMAAVFGAETRTETELARNLAENAQAEALADAGIYRAIAMLLDPDQNRWPRADGTPYRWSLAGGEVLVSIQDEAGKVDLNAAPDGLLQGLFISLGVAPDAASTLVDRIHDFTDREHIKRLNGAEDEDYRRAGVGYGAKHAPFDSVAELEQVLGMTHELFRRVEPFVTVYTGLTGINPLTASREVRAAALSAAQTDAGFKDRQASPLDTASPVMDLTSGAPGFAPPPAVTIRAGARTGAGGLFQREAVVLLSPQPFGLPFAIREWRRTWSASLPPSASLLEQ